MDRQITGGLFADHEFPQATVAVRFNLPQNPSSGCLQLHRLGDTSFLARMPEKLEFAVLLKFKTDVRYRVVATAQTESQHRNKNGS